MPLAPGARLGPYEVTALIGVGGMGEVYRATDTNLGRAVAIKVLPDAFAHDAERLARFEREARTLATLNHPHIAAIYGFEKASGAHALVMELVEGSTLADRIAHSAIPIDEALPIATQIAEALEAAHEQGIIHRDLKPANIKVRPDGTVKVLDFGLAKAIEPVSAASPSVSMSPTITSPAMMTGVGVILGTAVYMSPEQARGKTVDRRADIWAFACVLFEMLSGRRAFEDEDVSMTLSKVLQREPDFDLLPPAVPARVCQAIRVCLRKDSKQRAGDIRDVRLALEGAFETAVPQMAAPTTSPSRAARLAWIVAAAAVTGLAVLAFVHLRETPPVEPPETRLEITTPPGRLSFSKVSPDGRKVLFSTAAADGRAQLWLRLFESEAAQPLAGTEGASWPFWSPDSRSIAFRLAGKLMRLDLAGGSARALADAPFGLGGAWGPDGTIVFTPTTTSALYRVPAAGGPPVEVTHLNGPDEASHRLPDFLPDGRHFLFFVAGTANVQGVYLGSLDSTDTRRLLESDSAAVFAAPDYVLFARQNNLLAQRLDLKTFEVTGDSFSVAEQVSGPQGTAAEIAVSTSHTGLIAYRAPIRDPRQWTWFDRAGRQTGTLGNVETRSGGSSVRIAPDGRTVAVGRTISENTDVWLIETARGVLRRFASDPANDSSPVWAPDSNRIAFQSRRAGPNNLWLKRVDGGTEERLRESAVNEYPTDWSPDGRFILFRTEGVGQLDVWALPLDGERKPVAVANSTSSSETEGRFSLDGRRVAYQSNETGRNEIYVVPFPGPGVPTQVSINGGVTPHWREDGREIIYLDPDSRLMAVPITPQPDGRLEVGTPAILFPIPEGASYDITRDGQRILVDKPVGQAPTPPITIIQNWKPRS